MPGYLAIGHLAKDLLAGGAIRAGGTVLYATLTAQHLGVPAALVTALAPTDMDLLAAARAAGVVCQVRPSPTTTTFALEYHGEHRRLRLDPRAVPLHATDMPAAWRGTPILHLGPIAAEIDPAEPWDACCPTALLGVTPQGWLRRWDADGWIHPAPWTQAGGVLARADALVLSVEDVGGDEEAMMGYVKQARLAVVTAGARGAVIYEQGRRRAHVPSCRAQPVDFTGAGDVFTAGFLVRYHETGDPVAAARFAHAAAAYAIEGPGTAGIARRLQVEARMHDNET